MANLGTVSVTSYPNFWVNLKAYCNGRVISTTSFPTGNSSFSDFTVNFTSGDYVTFRFYSSTPYTLCSFSLLMSEIISNSPDLRFLTPTNFLNTLLYLAFSTPYYRIMSPYPYSGSYVYNNIVLRSGTTYYDSVQTFFQTIEPHDSIFYICRMYDEGTGFYRMVVTDSVNNPAPIFINYLKGDTGSQGPVGPQGPAGDPGPAGATPDLTPIVNQLILISEKLTSIDGNLMAVSDSAKTTVEVIGANV